MTSFPAFFSASFLFILSRHKVLSLFSPHSLTDQSVCLGRCPLMELLGHRLVLLLHLWCFLRQEAGETVSVLYQLLDFLIIQL